MSSEWLKIKCGSCSIGDLNADPRARVELEHQPGAGEVEEDQAGRVVRRGGWYAEQVGVERASALEVLGPLGYLHELHAAFLSAVG